MSLPGSGGCINISASYYTSCDGTNGACGDCSNTKLQCAWAFINGVNAVFNTCGADTCCSSDSPCADALPELACGDTLTVTDLCTNKAATITIADSGPYVCVCELGCTYNYSLLRAMDLTEAAFNYLQGSTSAGHIPVNVC